MLRLYGFGLKLSKETDGGAPFCQIANRQNLSHGGPGNRHTILHSAVEDAPGCNSFENPELNKKCPY